ncbi:autophagy-related protein 13-domain-containing protein [Mycotypha africana]|uniref:autophagy-related protein 13-domain-containing protein n=1 Tax=Mycotypha africana TaxID=64632 RepID=UPI002301C0F8|nr:autophagy-related protein 13-domain-containing protein [Mycotypha africana]KAI8988522.1 autophagy-related protein 13-domain-containing protein [Mycotypha africana]
MHSNFNQPSLQAPRPSSSSSSTTVPQSPFTSSTSTRNSKLDQIIQNFYTKTAQIIIQARCSPNACNNYSLGLDINNAKKRTSLKSSSSSTSRKLNKWFNVATEDSDLLREELRFWRNLAIQTVEETPPMRIDIYLDTSQLSSTNKSLMIADDNLRWSYIDLNKSHYPIDRIYLESWELSLRSHPFPDHAVDLPNLYKRSIVFFRALHSFIRLLPSYELYRKIHKHHSNTAGDDDAIRNLLSIGYRLSASLPSEQQQHPDVTRNDISLETAILNSDARKPTSNYDFNDIITPIGTFKLRAIYRRNCDFKIEDTEKDLSSHFIDMDEQFFTPTLAKYQQQQQQQQSSNRPSTRPVSMLSNRSPPTSINSRYSSYDNNEQQQRLRSNTSSSTTSNSRRASATFVVSPFKSPFLSSSPQADCIFSVSNMKGGASTNNNTTAASHPVSTSTNEAILSNTLSTTSGTMNTTLTEDDTSIDSNSTTSKPIETGTGGGGSSFGSRKIEFSSSFERYKSTSSATKNRLMSGSPSSISMTRRWSRTSDQNSSLYSFNRTEHDDETDELEDFVKLVGSSQELRMFNRNRNESATTTATPSTNTKHEPPVSDQSNSNSMIIRKSMLPHFQSLRETHDTLSDSLSTSMIMSQHYSSPPVPTPQQQRQLAFVATTTVSHHQPTITSPLHPKSLPPPQTTVSGGHQSSIAPPSPTKKQFKQDGYQQVNSCDKDLSAYSTYPQDYHRHQELQRYLSRPISLKNRALYHRKEDDEQPSDEINNNNNSSLMDDDDSLVFKMSELDTNEPCSSSITNISATGIPEIKTTPPPPTQQSPSSSSNYLELTPALTPPAPLLQRLQTLSSAMSAVIEEEEKSSSSSSKNTTNTSSSSSTSSLKPNSPSLLPFEPW